MDAGSIGHRAVGKVLSLKVTLDGTHPALWRRLLMPSEMTLGDLHQAIQAAMGWDNSHLHAFRVADQAYSDPEYELEEARDEERMTLGGLVDRGISRFRYVYDFGDSWRHTILIEKRLPKTEGRSLPACIAGSRNCPPEDCGGVGAYEHLVGILAGPQEKRQGDWVEMFGANYDPEAFCLVATDARMDERFDRA